VSKKRVILEAAARLFARNGFRETSMAELSEAAGVAGGTILYHFGTKEGLFLALLEDIRDRILARLDGGLAGNGFADGLEMVEGVVTAYLHMAGSMEDAFLLLHRHHPHQMAETNPECRRHLASIYNAMVDLFEKPVRVGQRDGSIRETPARKTAMILFSMVDGVARLSTYRLYEGAALYRELLEGCRRMLQA
jgi:AcrR family transcriptional regulator